MTKSFITYQTLSPKMKALDIEYLYGRKEMRGCMVIETIDSYFLDKIIDSFYQVNGLSHKILEQVHHLYDTNLKQVQKELSEPITILTRESKEQLYNIIINKNHFTLKDISNVLKFFMKYTGIKGSYALYNGLEKSKENLLIYRGKIIRPINLEINRLENKKDIQQVYQTNQRKEAIKKLKETFTKEEILEIAYISDFIFRKYIQNVGYKNFLNSNINKKKEKEKIIKEYKIVDLIKERYGSNHILAFPFLSEVLIYDLKDIICNEIIS